MDQNIHKKQQIINTRLISSLLLGLGFFTLILIITMLASSGKQGAVSKSGSKKPTNNQKEVIEGAAYEQTILAVLKAYDSDNKKVTLYDIKEQVTIELSYTGGTDIRDKFDQVILIKQIPIGSILEASYKEGNNKLSGLKISDQAWEYVGVNNISIDFSQKTMKIASNLYKYTDSILVIDDGEAIPVTKLAEQDELTVWGYEETIWSVTVTRGHGTVKLTDYEAFLGAELTIGYESMQQITDGMEITVREGDFNLTVENGKYSATKNITVVRNQLTTVSLSDLGPLAQKQGRVTFEITPKGADLYINKELTDYSDPVELPYGNYQILVSLGGYTSYQGKLAVDTAGKTVRIDLPENTGNSKDTPTVTETDSEGGSSVSGGQSNSGPDGNNDEEDPDIANPGEKPSDTGSDYDEDEDVIIDKNHFIHVQNPTGASVYLDGDFMCIAPGSFQKVIGNHVLTFIKEGYETMSYTIEVADDGVDAYYSFSDLKKK